MGQLLFLTKDTNKEKIVFWAYDARTKTGQSLIKNEP